MFKYPARAVTRGLLLAVAQHTSYNRLEDACLTVPPIRMIAENRSDPQLRRDIRSVPSLGATKCYEPTNHHRTVLEFMH